MTLRTITFDDEQWQVVPKKMAPVMWHAAIAAHDAIGAWVAALANAPEPPAQPEAPTRDLLAEARGQVEALDRENHQMRRCVARLMARLTMWLDDDQFNEADGILHPEFEPPAQHPMTDAARDVLAERRRQVEVEGWTPEHDDKHASGDLATAAGCYALHAALLAGGYPDAFKGMVPSPWPWSTKWWKPGDPRRTLVKAGALILAEIERLDRASAGEGESA